jgi:hypothetical protein
MVPRLIVLQAVHLRAVPSRHLPVISRQNTRGTPRFAPTPVAQAPSGQRFRRGGFGASGKSAARCKNERQHERKREEREIEGFFLRLSYVDGGVV